MANEDADQHTDKTGYIIFFLEGGPTLRLGGSVGGGNPYVCGDTFLPPTQYWTQYRVCSPLPYMAR